MQGGAIHAYPAESPPNPKNPDTLYVIIHKYLITSTSLNNLKYNFCYILPKLSEIKTHRKIQKRQSTCYQRVEGDKSAIICTFGTVLSAVFVQTCNFQQNDLKLAKNITTPNKLKRPAEEHGKWSGELNITMYLCI